MKIIGCDFHPSFQQIAVFERETGEIIEHKLVNGNGEAERFYRSLPVPSLIGIEACGNSHWFIDLLAQLGTRPISCAPSTTPTPTRCAVERLRRAISQHFVDLLSSLP